MPDEQVDYVVREAGVTKEEYINKINTALNELKTGKGLGTLGESSSESINSISLSYVNNLGLIEPSVRHG